MATGDPKLWALFDALPGCAATSAAAADAARSVAPPAAWPKPLPPPEPLPLPTPPPLLSSLPPPPPLLLAPLPLLLLLLGPWLRMAARARSRPPFCAHASCALIARRNGVREREAKREGDD